MEKLYFSAPLFRCVCVFLFNENEKNTVSKREFFNNVCFAPQPLRLRISSAEEQKCIILQLLLQNTKQQQQIRNKPILQVKLFFD